MGWMLRKQQTRNGKRQTTNWTTIYTQKSLSPTVGNPFGLHLAPKRTFAGGVKGWGKGSFSKGNNLRLSSLQLSLAPMQIWCNIAAEEQMEPRSQDSKRHPCGLATLKKKTNTLINITLYLIWFPSYIENLNTIDGIFSGWEMFYCCVQKRTLFLNNSYLLCGINSRIDWNEN